MSYCIVQWPLRTKRLSLIAANLQSRKLFVAEPQSQIDDILDCPKTTEHRRAVVDDRQKPVNKEVFRTLNFGSQVNALLYREVAVEHQVDYQVDYCQPVE